MKPIQPAPGEKNPDKSKENSPVKEENKIISALKKVGFHVWLGVMIIGGVLAFITALFLV